MMTAALLAVLAAVAALGPAAAQNTLYSNDGCRITGSGSEVNVTCTCGQKLRQTSDSLPIDHLDITGCMVDDSTNQRPTRLSFLPPSHSADAFDFVLLHVRSVNVSQIHLRLEPVRGSPEAAGHPLQRLHLHLVQMTNGLPDGALQGLPSLERVSLEYVQCESAARSALADLPRLRELTITNSHFQFVKTGMLTRTPRLRRLRLSKNKFDYVGIGAIVVENDNDDNADSSGACSPDDDSWLEFDAMVINTMSANAVRVSAVRQLLVTKSSIGVMHTGALNVTLRAPDDCQPLLRFTENTITDARAEAVAVQNEAATPADLELGAIVLLSSVLSPYELRLYGDFERRTVAGLPPNQFECNCCECPGTRRLVEVALQPGPSRLDTDVFVAALGSARCVGDTKKTFLEFASGCVPDENLMARVAELVSLPAPPPALPSTPPNAAWRPVAGLLLLLPPLALAAAVRG